MTAGLTLGVTAAVVVACSTGAYLYSAHHFRSLVEAARTEALAQGEMIRVALEHQMMENDRSLIGRMIESFGSQPKVERVVLLDRAGTKRFAGGKMEQPGELEIGSPTCQACHRDPPGKRAASRVIETRNGTLLRTVVPILNRPACHRCHDPGHRINGILILDYDAGEMRASMTRELWWLVVVCGALTLLLMGALALVIRVAVLRRLQRFETVARRIAAGDVESRLPAEGSDTLSWMAREFNAMADSVTGLAAEVRSQRERLETVINSIDDGIVVLDPKRTVIAANEAFLQRVTRSRDQVLGCCCRDLAPGACDTSDCPTLACLGSGARHVRLCERRSADGSAAWEEIHASPIQDRAGELRYVVEVWRDISERRAAEARLAESHRLASLGMLASGFSHELNTPLGTILMCVEGILREVNCSEPASPDLERLRRSGSIAREQVLRCRGITQHFLRLSRGQDARTEMVDLDAAIGAVVRLIEPTARAHSVIVEVMATAPGQHVRASEAELQQTVLNLLLNAVQASSSGGRVVVESRFEDGPCVRVTDNGCGLAQENLKHIFEPFFSLRKGGTGLGLFLSLNSVRGWGGDLRVESTPGAGSTFEILFPASPKAAVLEVR
jgi:PAS domain S-box-containing protein